MFFGSHLFQVIGIKNKTYAKFFKDIKIGDQLQFTLDLIYVNTVNVRVIHMRENKEIAVWENTQNNFVKKISNFKFAIAEETLNIRFFEDHMEEIEEL